MAQSFMVAGCSSDGSVARLTNNDKNLEWRTYDEQSTRLFDFKDYSLYGTDNVYEILFPLIVASLLVSTIDCSIIETSYKL